MMANRFFKIVLSLICGISSFPAYSSVGAQPVLPGKYRQTVALVYSRDNLDLGEVYCSGTLIGPRVVITAAHCLLSGAKAFGVSLEQFQQRTGIYLGDTLPTKSLPLVPITLMSDQVFIHPQNPTIQTDLALIILKSAVPSDLLPSGTFPIVMAQQNMRGLPLTTVGFGTIEQEGVKGFKTAFTLPLASLTGHSGLGIGEAFTAGPSACHGDSGGSAYITDKTGQVFFAGVEYSISNHPCGNAATYFVPFSEKNLSWIKSFGFDLF